MPDIISAQGNVAKLDRKAVHQRASQNRSSWDKHLGGVPGKIVAPTSENVRKAMARKQGDKR